MEPMLATNILNDTLYTLWVETSKFNILRRGKAVFNFTINADNLITLCSWDAKDNSGNKFDINPIDTLKTGMPTGFKIVPGVFFGNLFIDKNDINRIIQDAGSNKYLIFYPRFYIDAKHLVYEIGWTNDDPRTTTITG